MFCCFYTVSSMGKVIYSEVITFLQKDPNTIEKYTSITTLCNKSLRLSRNHLVYTRRYSSDEFNAM